MNLRYTLIAALFFFSSYSIIAQDSNLLQNTSVNRVTTRQLKIFDGSDAYLLKEWKLGKVIFGNGTFQYLPINYNAYDKRLEWQKDGQALTFDQPVNAFVIGDTSITNGYFFASGFYPVDKQDAYSFYQVLYRSPSSQILKFVEYKTLESRKFNDANFTVKFEPYETYYYSDGTNHLTKIRSNKKDLLKLFPKKGASLEQYMEENGVKIKDWDDMINMVGYADMLE